MQIGNEVERMSTRRAYEGEEFAIIKQKTSGSLDATTPAEEEELAVPKGAKTTGTLCWAAPRRPEADLRRNDNDTQ